jgi:hypothetical protein
MRLAPTWFAVLGLFAGCGGDGAVPHPDAPAPAIDALDAYVAPWWTPTPGEARNWDVQWKAPFDVSAPRAMYDLDLWALVPAATVIDYGDADPVTVPAGVLAGTIAQLHATTPRTIVICHVDTGAIRLSDPDARKFPGYHPNPPGVPDRPSTPESGSAIGWNTGDPTERFLDITAAGRAAWSAKMFKRLDLAKQIGCDGVEGDRNDQVQSDPGFNVQITDQTSWYTEIATQVHMRALSAGMKDGYTLPGQTDALADDFDWIMVQRCGEFQDCGNVRPFINVQKAAFTIDYQNDVDGMAQSPAVICPHVEIAMVQDGLIKNDPPTSAFRHQCTP